MRMPKPGSQYATSRLSGAQTGKFAPWLRVVEATFRPEILIAEDHRRDSLLVGREGEIEEARGLPDRTELLAVEVEPGQAAPSN